MSTTCFEITSSKFSLLINFVPVKQRHINSDGRRLKIPLEIHYRSANSDNNISIKMSIVVIKKLGTVKKLAEHHKIWQIKSTYTAQASSSD